MRKANLPSITAQSWIGLALFLFIAENAVTDLLLPAPIKQSIVALALGAILFINIDFLSQDDSYIKWAFFGAAVCLLGSGLRLIFIEDEGVLVAAKDLFQFLSAAILLRVFVDEMGIRRVPGTQGRLRRVGFALMLLSLPLISFGLFLANPVITFSFEDNQGHQLSILYASLSSSIYKIGALEFARMSLIFDEPGTCGVFFSLLSGCLYMREGKISSIGLVVLLLGIPTLSLAYFIYLVALVLWDSLSRFATGRGALSGLATILVITLATAGLATISEGGITTYLAERVMSTSEGEHNRSEGNTEAMAAIKGEPLGLPAASFRDRELTSSGILVIAAYKGIFYALGFLVLYGYFVIRVRSQFPCFFGIAASIFIAVVTRNNFFNYSGPVLLLVADYFAFTLAAHPKPIQKHLVRDRVSRADAGDGNQ